VASAFEIIIDDYEMYISIDDLLALSFLLVMERGFGLRLE